MPVTERAISTDYFAWSIWRSCGGWRRRQLGQPRGRTAQRLPGRCGTASVLLADYEPGTPLARWSRVSGLYSVGGPVVVAPSPRRFPARRGRLSIKTDAFFPRMTEDVDILAEEPKRPPTPTWLCDHGVAHGPQTLQAG
jgi:hypothetical protein